MTWFGVGDDLEDRASQRLELRCDGLDPSEIPSRQRFRRTILASLGSFIHREALRALSLREAAGAVVGDDLLEHRRGRGIDGVVAVEGDHPRRLVLVASGNDPFWIRDNPAVAKRNRLMWFSGGKKRAHVALEREVGSHGPLGRLDQFLDRRRESDHVGRRQIACELPVGERVDVGQSTRGSVR